MVTEKRFEVKTGHAANNSFAKVGLGELNLNCKPLFSFCTSVKQTNKKAQPSQS